MRVPSTPTRFRQIPLFYCGFRVTRQANRPFSDRRTRTEHGQSDPPPCPPAPRTTRGAPVASSGCLVVTGASVAQRPPSASLTSPARPPRRRQSTQSGTSSARSSNSDRPRQLRRPAGIPESGTLSLPPYPGALERKSGTRTWRPITGKRRCSGRRSASCYPARCGTPATGS
jgi:hypothetical protein